MRAAKVGGVRGVVMRFQKRHYNFLISLQLFFVNDASENASFSAVAAQGDDSPKDRQIPDCFCN